MSLENIEEVLDYAEDLAYLFDVPVPPVHFSCEQMCSHASTCKWIGCFRHIDGSINFRTGYANPVVLDHEWGHFLFHSFYPGRCLGGSMACEEAAIGFEEWAYGLSKRSDTHTLFRCLSCAAIINAEVDPGVIGCPECGTRYLISYDGSISILGV